jgi:hypothetical protein
MNQGPLCFLGLIRSAHNVYYVKYYVLERAVGRHIINIYPYMIPLSMVGGSLCTEMALALCCMLRVSWWKA